MAYLLTMTLHIGSIKGFLVTVIGWFASAVILFSLIGVEARKHRQARVHETYIYTENFFAGTISASLYVLIAGLLLIYMVRMQVSPFSMADRRKIECASIVFRSATLAFLLLSGAAVFSSIEGWSLMDALYFTDYTLLTIGIGNLVPNTHLGRSLLFPYATLGITSLGFMITAVTSFTHRIRELKLKWKIEETLRENTVACFSTVDGVESRTASARNSIPKGREILRVRKVKSAFYRKRRWTELVLFLAAWFILWLVSAGIFRRSETEDNWTYFVALYFTYTSLTTIGYGDFFPTSNFGKVFFIFWSLLAIPILTNLVTAIGDVVHIWLVFCSGWIWRNVFRRGHPKEHHDHKNVGNYRDTLDSIAKNKYSKLKSRDSDLDIESQRLGGLETRNGSPSAQESNKERTMNGNEKHRIISRRASTKYRLLLAEEIRNLISMKKDESLGHHEKLCCTWSRVISLLQVEGNNGNLSELTPTFESTKSEHDLSKRSAEISWMLDLLVDRLSSDLRKELSE